MRCVKAAPATARAGVHTNVQFMQSPKKNPLSERGHQSHYFRLRRPFGRAQKELA
jgi:hypothetical protein